MIPRAIIQLIPADVPEAEDRLEFTWFDYHPGDDIQQALISYITSLESSCTDIIVRAGHVIFLRWDIEENHGICTVMAAIADDFYKIAIETYNWSQFATAYVDADISNWDELSSLYKQDYHDPTINEIPKEIHKDWFDIAIDGGIFELDRSTSDYHFNVANIFGFFPWIVLFATKGSLSSSSFTLQVSIEADYDLATDEIFEHVNGELDEQFWLLIYQFVEKLDTIAEDKQADVWYRYLQAVHDFTTDGRHYEERMTNLFQYRDILSNFDVEFLRTYVHDLLMDIADQPSSVQLCESLLDLSKLLLELELTDLGKLAEGTTLEHALTLTDNDTKHDIIMELTRRSSTWGDSHLISFIQSLTGLLGHTSEGQEILSDAINLIQEQLSQTWDGMLCLVEGKLISDKVGDALKLRFEATQQLPDKFTRAEDIFSALIWSLQYDWSATNRYQLVISYLDFAFEHLPSETLIGQSDVVIQSSVNHGRFKFLRYYLQYIRTQLSKIDQESHSVLMDKIEEVLPSPQNYPLIHIEYLINRLFALQFVDEITREEQEFDIVGQIYNTINPTLSEASASLEYIVARIVEFGTLVGDWDIIEEGRRRFLLMSQDQDRAQEHLQTILFKFALDRSKLSKDEVESQDIGIQLFNEGLALSDPGKDYDLIKQIFPHIKKLAIKSRSYSALTDLVIAEIRLKKVHNEEWIPQLLKDIDLILQKGKQLDVTMIFSEAFTNLDLTTKERRELIKAQLKLTEVEPDLLTADEIYDKRLELIQLNPEDGTDQAFIVDNFQQGVSELISKGDTENLTNLLLDAISYTQEQDADEIEEFKSLLLDNFKNIGEDYTLSQSSQLYQYMMTIWRRVIDLFMNTDISTIIDFASYLIYLNIKFYRASNRSMYLRRSQLIMKELSLVVDKSSQDLDGTDISSVLVDHNEIMDLMVAKQKDFGIFTAIFHSAEVLSRFDLTSHLFALLDQAISNIKREVIIDPAAQSSIFLLLLILSEVALFIEADLHAELMTEITNRADSLLSFALSLQLSSAIKDQLRDLQQSLNQDPSAIIHEYPFSLSQYLNETLQYQT